MTLLLEIYIIIVKNQTLCYILIFQSVVNENQIYTISVFHPKIDENFRCLGC